MQWTFLEGKGHSRRGAMSSTHTILFEFGWKLFKATIHHYSHLNSNWPPRLLKESKQKTLILRVS